MIPEDFRDTGRNEFDAVGRPKLGSLATTRGILAASLIVTVCGWVVGCGNEPTTGSTTTTEPLAFSASPVTPDPEVVFVPVASPGAGVSPAAARSTA